jgi:Survival motor neuron (SMN) interacting protein 1 (SIP1)
MILTVFAAADVIYSVFRSEAKGVPHVLVGPNQTPHLEGTNRHSDEEDEGGGGYYEDGAFIAAPGPASNPVASKDTPLDAQEAYYMSLVSRFRELRLFLRQIPPLSAIEALTSNHPISLPHDSEKARQQWRFLLQSQNPQMAQLACMDMETVLEVVKLLRGVLAGTARSRSKEKLERLGAWTWGVLGKCNEAGLLGSEEVSELRELGKRAVGLLVGIRDRSGKDYGREEDEAEGETALGDRHGVDEENAAISQTEPTAGRETTNITEAEIQESWESISNVDQLEHAKAFLQDQLGPEGGIPRDGAQAEEGEIEEGGGVEDEDVHVSVDRQVRILLDMIITIVGELYGQRDLLEFRDIWGDEVAGPPDSPGQPL